ncbi:MAG: PRC-barrel domain-containing protein [Candidatus Dormibacteraeota bacterium]|nr:PRC-barrel domain-containing protein [Candidatus Dormibacteraeota bacterium]MBO0743748.1 PRC-barrel domain-containing protein [Candidatus Dormibacteraeota bacterium]
MRTLDPGEEVIGSDGRRLGSVSRLVVDEAAHRVTHLVIGDRVVGIGHLRRSEDGRLTLDLDRAGLKAQPDLAAARLEGVPAHWQAPDGWALGSFLRIANAFVGQEPYTPPIAVDDDAANVHEVTPGSPVWSGYTELGRVDLVDTADDGTISRIIVGAHHPRRRVAVPVQAVQEVVGNNVHLNLSPDAFAKLPAPQE